MERSPPVSPNPHLSMTLRCLVEWLTGQQVPYVIIGGVAVSLLAKPRFTQDVDVAVSFELDQLEEFLASATPHGLVARRQDYAAFARRNRVLLLRHEPTGISVDVSFIAMPFEEDMIASAHTVEVEGMELRLPRPEDLIIMKAVAHRSQDLVDLEYLIETHPTLDLTRVQQLVEQFAQALEAPDLLNDFQALLARLRRKGLLRQVFGKPD
jgi:predicted nucleotidyltransferase